MQNLPVILAVFMATAAIIAVLFWRIKPQTAPNTDALDKRIAEEIKRAEMLQAKLDANESSQREAIGVAATAKAKMEAANALANSAESKAAQIKAEFDKLQEKYNNAEPLVATATAQKNAAEKTQTELVHRHNDLIAKYDTLILTQADLLERAAKSEKDAATAKAEAEAVRQSAETSNARLSDATKNLATINADAGNLRSLLAEAIAQHEAMETAKNDLDQRFVALATKHDMLLKEYKLAVECAASAEKEAENVHTRNGEILGAYETITQELSVAKRELVEAAAKQQSGEDAARQFENLSQTIFKETMREAKQGIEELAKSLQQSSGVELEKHADKVAQTLAPLQAKLLAYDESIKKMIDYRTHFLICH